MAKVPTRSPTHADLDQSRIASMGAELESVAIDAGDADGAIALAAIVELAEDRGRPPAHYVAALALATDIPLAPSTTATLTAKICVGACQQWGALDLADHLIAHHAKRVALAPSTCLDRCDRAPAIELHGAGGSLVLAPATVAELDEAIAQLAP